MALSALGLVTDFGQHLSSDTAIEEIVGDSVFHARVDEDESCPFVLFRMLKVDHRDRTGHGRAYRRRTDR